MANGWDQKDLDALQKRRQPTKAAPGATIAPKAGKRAKYGNTAVLVAFGAAGELVSGHLKLEHWFDSAKEAAYYRELTLRRQAGEITRLTLQEPLPLLAWAASGPVIVGEWYADFVYDDTRDGRRHYIDVKSEGTKGIATYRLKKKIIEACHGITIEER